jgi:hypothetical protein
MNTTKSRAREGKVVQRLDEFPQLLEALRDGDLLTARLFCAQLFGGDRRQRQTRDKSNVHVKDSITARRAEGT